MSTTTPDTAPAATTLTTQPDPTPETAYRTQLASKVLDFIATVSLEYGQYDPKLFHAIVDWLGPVAGELSITAILVPNTVNDPQMPSHEVMVLDTGEEYFLFTTAWNPNIQQPVVVCARPPFQGPGHHVLLHATEAIFKISLATPGSPFLPEVPHWVRRAG